LSSQATASASSRQERALKRFTASTMVALQPIRWVGCHFRAVLGIRCLGLPSFFAHFCKQAIKRDEHLLVV
jgi:hypothetical protein